MAAGWKQVAPNAGAAQRSLNEDYRGQPELRLRKATKLMAPKPYLKFESATPLLMT